MARTRNAGSTDPVDAVDDRSDVIDAPAVRSSMEAFSAQQRILASDALNQVRIPDLGLIQNAVARSVDFGALAKLRTISAQAIGDLASARIATTLVDSVNLAAIAEATTYVAEIGALATATEQLTQIAEQWTRVSAIDQLKTMIDSLDLAKLTVPGWLPENLADSSDLDEVAEICLDEGLPLAWVPRAEIVAELVAATDAEERQAILLERRADVLDDCERALANITHELADQCRKAIRADRANFPEPAQSHAAGIIDSIVVAIHGGDGRNEVARLAQVPVDDLPLRVACEHFVLRPLFLCFKRWWAASATPVPKHFARHATAHAVGQADVFTPINSLVAIMLATSLTVEFWEEI
jgi:hypothetical protein